MSDASALATDTKAAARAVEAVKIYGSGETEVRALDGVDITFEKGKFSAIMGPSGSGKSTLMHCMAALDNLTEGQAFIGDTDLSTLSDKELTLLRRDRVGFSSRPSIWYHAKRHREHHPAHGPGSART